VKAQTTVQNIIQSTALFGAQSPKSRPNQRDKAPDPREAQPDYAIRPAHPSGPNQTRLPNQNRSIPQFQSIITISVNWLPNLHFKAELGHSKAQLPIILRGIILRDFTIQISIGKVNSTKNKHTYNVAREGRPMSPPNPRVAYRRNCLNDYKCRWFP
jgi:hypothetical protein